MPVIPDWNGFSCSPGAIVYVGLRARFAGFGTMFDFKRTYILWVVLVLLPLLFVFW